MLTRDQFVDAMAHECKVAKHLFSKIPEGGMDYCPTPGQRSMLELLQYLSICGEASLKSMLAGNWDVYGDVSARSKEMKAEDFPAAMDLQIQEIREAMSTVSEKDLLERETVYVTKETMPLGLGLLKSYAWLVAYRMQLFLYAKQAGASELSTVNAWLGMDPATAS